MRSGGDWGCRSRIRDNENELHCSTQECQVVSNHVISEIRIRNFKSIEDLTFKPGRVTVLIGENGSGKSNILESIAFAAAASADKLDKEFLVSRGIRVAEYTWMKSAFPPAESCSGAEESRDIIQLSVTGEDGEPPFQCSVAPSVSKVDGSFEEWIVRTPIKEADLEEALRVVDEELKPLSTQVSGATGKIDQEALRRSVAAVQLGLSKYRWLNNRAKRLGVVDYLIYAPENTVLRTPPPDATIEPLGARGEGLFKLLQAFGDAKFTKQLADLKDSLHLFGWFDDFLPPDDVATAQARLQIRDRWLAPERAVFDQRSANEGFLYTLFYLTAITSWRTPKFFAIDNVDTALNPKLCSALMRKIVELAKKYDKQVICTTHNPAILDGLNIHDDEQRLLTVQRDSEGRTTVNRVRPPKAQPGKVPMKLSAAFVAGNIGGLPDYF